MKPRYKHDCEKCLFLGTFEEYDLYYCETTIVARFGDSPESYLSGMSVGRDGIVPALAEAYRLTVEKGLPTECQQ